MNSPTLLISPGAVATGAVATAGAEAPAEEGFASALASSIAGVAKQAEAGPDGTAPELLQAGSSEEDPSLADVMQWLGLPAATPAPPVDVAAGETVPGITDDFVGESQQQALAVATRVAARSAAPASGTAAEDGISADDVATLMSGAPVPEATPSTAGGAVPPQPTPAGSVQLPQVQPLAVLTTALVRDGAAATGNASGGTAVHASLREPVGSARWAEELGTRMVLMSVRGQQEGSLTLTPEHLGPLEIQISVNRDTANVWFGAQHADTRTALTEALPRLRELLAASGLSLGQAGVSEQAPRREAGSEVPRGFGASGEEGVVVGEAAEVAWRPMRTSLIDTYA